MSYEYRGSRERSCKNLIYIQSNRGEGNRQFLNNFQLDLKWYFPVLGAYIQQPIKFYNFCFNKKLFIRICTYIHYLIF